MYVFVVKSVIGLPLRKKMKKMKILELLLRLIIIPDIFFILY